MADWRTHIRCFVSAAGRNKIADWYNDLTPVEQASADAQIGDMRKTTEWGPPAYAPLFDGIGEIRWQCCGKQHRLLGFFHEGYWCALIGCTHKQQVYKPADAKDTAKKRKKKVEQGEAETVEYDL